jgi:hypothetical protein
VLKRNADAQRRRRAGIKVKRDNALSEEEAAFVWSILDEIRRPSGRYDWHKAVTLLDAKFGHHEEYGSIDQDEWPGMWRGGHDGAERTDDGKLVNKCYFYNGMSNVPLCRPAKE